MTEYEIALREAAIINKYWAGLGIEANARVEGDMHVLVSDIAFRVPKVVDGKAYGARVVGLREEAPLKKMLHCQAVKRVEPRPRPRVTSETVLELVP